MNYLEKVLNERIDELKEENKKALNSLKGKLNNNGLTDTFDIYECYLDIDANEVRIDELEKLKKGLGLIPAAEAEKTRQQAA